MSDDVPRWYLLFLWMGAISWPNQSQNVAYAHCELSVFATRPREWNNLVLHESCLRITLFKSGHPSWCRSSPHPTRLENYLSYINFLLWWRELSWQRKSFRDRSKQGSKRARKQASEQARKQASEQATCLIAVVAERSPKLPRPRRKEKVRQSQPQSQPQPKSQLASVDGLGG